MKTDSDILISRDGCRGEQVGIRWDDGTITFPCTRDMEWTEKEGVWRLI